MGRSVGYDRVSTSDPSTEVRATALRAAGAEEVFVDRVDSVLVAERPQWTACLDRLSPGDTLLISALDRIAGGEVMAVRTIADLHRRGLEIRSLAEPEIDTTAPGGRALFGTVDVFARLRGQSIRDGTHRGLAAARSRGRVGGRPSVMSAERVAEAVQMREAGESHSEIARVLGVGASTVGRALAKSDRERPRAQTEQRVFLRDHKPYFAPTSLDALLGPSGGILELPHHVHWGPQQIIDLDSRGGLLKAYEAVLQEGSAADQTAVLNRDRLAGVWEELALPVRVRLLWEKRFPELLQQARA